MAVFNSSELLAFFSPREVDSTISNNSGLRQNGIVRPWKKMSLDCWFFKFSDNLANDLTETAAHGKLCSGTWAILLRQKIDMKSL
jgi:hypothetical protein